MGNEDHAVGADQATGLNLAKIRWYLNAIENEALQIYASGQNYAAMFATLDQAFTDLRDLGVKLPPPSCPLGWERCLDGTCRPKCPDGRVLGDDEPRPDMRPSPPH